MSHINLTRGRFLQKKITLHPNHPVSKERRKKTQHRLELGRRAVCFIIAIDDREPIDRPFALSALKRAHWSGGSQRWGDGGAEWLKHQRRMKKTSLYLWHQPSHQDSFDLQCENVECSLFLSVMDSWNECTPSAKCTSLEIISLTF